MRAAIVVFILLAASQANAYFQMDMMKAKRTEKQNVQWTLSDWLSQKSA